MNVTQGIKKITLEAEIKRADGTIENLGPVAEYNMDPKKQSKLLGGINVLNPRRYAEYLRGR